MPQGGALKPNLLAIVPPYAVWGPPAGAAALLAYLKAAGCHDFSFLDLRLLAPDVVNPTYRTVGPFGESFVLDIPDLPLVLAILEQAGRGGDLADLPDEVVVPFCEQRALNPLHVRSYISRMARLFTQVFDAQPDLRFVGFSVWTSNYLTTVLAAAILKRRARPPYVVVGGPQVSQSPASARLGLRAGLFDAVVVGEGEQALLDLYTRFSEGQGQVDGPVGGVLTRRGDQFVHTPRKLLKLVELPLPDFDEMHLPAYSLGGKRVVSYQLSRGCTDKCHFCSEWVFWERFRLTRAERAVADIAELQRRWGAERIWFTDSLLNGSPKHLKAFAQGLVDAGIEIDWSGYMRAQTDVETAQLLRRSGCMWVFIGMESLDDETLQAMNKRRTERQNLSAIQAFLQAGIQVKVGLIPGFPGDTPEKFVRTARLVRGMLDQHRLLGVSHEAFVVLPGQPIYENLEDFGLRPVPWSDDVLGIAPTYSDIAAQTWCRVEGDNQGAERLGLYSLSMSLTGPAQPFDGDMDHHRETITPYELHSQAVGGDVWLLRTVASSGHTVGWLATTREKDQLLANTTKSVRPTPLLDTDDVGPVLRSLLDEHLAYVPADRPVVAAARYRTPPVQAPMALGPVTIARQIGGELWLANLATGVHGRCPTSDTVARALVDQADPTGLPGATELLERGLLVLTEAPVVGEPAVASIAHS